jgi:hypothetical protein
MRSVALAVRGSHDEVDVLELVVKPVEADLDAIQCAGHTLGYVQRAGRVFVSLVGERADRAEECAQSLAWDLAAARLSTYCTHA